MSFRSVLKLFIPNALLKARQKRIIRQTRERFEGMSTREAFSEIYASNLWGGKPGEIRSGSGSTETHALEYAQLVKSFVAEHDIRSIVDVGCGDFLLGSKFATAVESYLGVDIVPDVVKTNNAKFGSGSVRFECLDAIEDPLPKADLCLIRQVLQHLSNEQIMQILPKLSCYKFVMLTEHYPAEGVGFVPNKEKPHGPDIRVYDNSAVVLDEAPFNIASSELLLTFPADIAVPDDGETVRTHLFPGSAFAESSAHTKA